MERSNVRDVVVPSQRLPGTAEVSVLIRMAKPIEIMASSVRSMETTENIIKSCRSTEEQTA